MGKNVVNLDALIPREDFAVQEAAASAGDLTNELTISTLRDAFFAPSLRKPDFQRETTSWSPRKVVDIIKAFVDHDLIPAVILWRTGSFTFVIDGSHRLSALLAWIHDDYGDRRKSIEYFGGHIPPEQEQKAKTTRRMVLKEIGSFIELEALGLKRSELDDQTLRRVNNIGTNKVMVQWVNASDAKVAEKSFFKINQEATPLDPVEKRILMGRDSANAMAARAINTSGYWASILEFV